MTPKVNSRWIFDEIRLKNSPSNRDGIGCQEEMGLRQSGTYFIKDMAKMLKLKSICMNTAIVYFHRFFTFRSFKRYDLYQIAVCSLFLAAKFEEQPIFKEHMIKVSLICRKHQKPLNEKEYEVLIQSECEKLFENEAEMLLTFGFDLSVIHPHTVIISACQTSVINRTISGKAYRICDDLSRLTTICLQFKPTFIACVCIYLSSHFLNITITSDKVNGNWCQLIDKELNIEEVERVAKQQFMSKVNKNDFTDNLNVPNVPKKRSHSFEDTCSPESCYSSGSSSSPIYDNLAKPNSVSTKSMINNNNNNKHIRCEQSSTLGKNNVKSKQSLQSKTSSTTNSLINSHSKHSIHKVLPNHTTANRTSSSGAHQLTHTDLQNSDHKQKFQKTIKPNGEVVRQPMPSDSCAASLTANTSKMGANKMSINSINNNHVMSSSTKRTSNSAQNINNKLVKKNFDLNLKITFSTISDNKTSDSNKSSINRIVREAIVSNSKTVKIES